MVFIFFKERDLSDAVVTCLADTVGLNFTHSEHG